MIFPFAIGSSSMATSSSRSSNMSAMKESIALKDPIEYPDRNNSKKIKNKKLCMRDPELEMINALDLPVPRNYKGYTATAEDFDRHWSALENDNDDDDSVLGRMHRAKRYSKSPRVDVDNLKMWHQHVIQKNKMKSLTGWQSHCSEALDEFVSIDDVCDGEVVNGEGTASGKGDNKNDGKGGVQVLTVRGLRSQLGMPSDPGVGILPIEVKGYKVDDRGTVVGVLGKGMFKNDFESDDADDDGEQEKGVDWKGDETNDDCKCDGDVDGQLDGKQDGDVKGGNGSRVGECDDECDEDVEGGAGNDDDDGLDVAVDWDWQMC
jgi:hypothetical protein